MKTSLTPVALQVPESGVPRSVGIHVSSVIKAIAAESGILKAEYVESLDLIEVNQVQWWQRLKHNEQLRIAIGLAWDQWYLDQLGYVASHPGEMEVEGIYLTPDGESMDVLHLETGPEHVIAIHEVKSTYKSVKTVGDLMGQWMWLAQMRAYCKAAGTRLAFLHVLFLCGDYTYPITPQIGPTKDAFTCWRIEFTQEEIDETWDLLVGYVLHRKQMGAEA